MKTIGILGAGYVGLATAASFAARGFSVTCADPNEKKIEILQQGGLPFFEEGMLEVFCSAPTPVIFTTDLSLACKSDIVFCCVGTPSAADGSADLSFVKSAALTCAEVAPNRIFVLKSTVPPGTSRLIDEFVKGRLRVIANPEFLREGSAVYDGLHPSRIIIGADNGEDSAMLEEIYKDVDAPIVVTDTVTAEMVKYASNSFLATKISFINEMAGLCDVVGADARIVAKGMGLDDRIGSKFLEPGPGYGGSCFPKDVRALMHLGHSVGMPLKILEATSLVNTERQSLSFRMLEQGLGSLVGKRIAVWGLAFKPGTDDVRDAPALELLRQCLAVDAQIIAFDPLVHLLSSDFSRVEIAHSMLDAVTDADALVIMTNWPEFSLTNREQILSCMKGSLIVDLRYVLRG